MQRALYLFAAACLYMGPLTAGLGRLSWGMLLPFLLIFCYWQMTLRPASWPRGRAEWSDPRHLLVLLTTVLAMTLLVLVVMGIGRGLGGVVGNEEMVNPSWPLVLSSLGIIVLTALVAHVEKVEAAAPVGEGADAGG